MSLTIQEIFFQVSIVCFVACAAMTALAVRTFVTKKIRDVLADLSGKKRQEETSGTGPKGAVQAGRDRGRSAFWMGRETGGSGDLRGSGDLSAGGESDVQKVSAGAPKRSLGNVIEREAKADSARVKTSDDFAAGALSSSAGDDDRTDWLAADRQASLETDGGSSQTVVGDDGETIAFVEANDHETTILVDGEDDLVIESEEGDTDEDELASDFIVTHELSFYGSDDVMTAGKGKI